MQPFLRMNTMYSLLDEMSIKMWTPMLRGATLSAVNTAYSYGKNE